MKKTIVIMLFVVFLPVVLLLTSVQVTVNSDRFFSQQYTSNQVPTKTQMEMTELLRVTNEIQDYLLGQRQDFYIEGTVNGEVRQIFTEREVKHMVDVQVLFKRGIMLRNISVLLLTILCLWLWPKDKKLLFSALLVSALTFFSLAILMGLLLYFDFNRYFVLFHEIFFDNDLWILDPQTSILINMVPLPFFIAIVKRIGLLVTGMTLLVGMAGYGGRTLLRTQEHSLGLGRKK